MYINTETHIPHNATWLHLFIRACNHFASSDRNHNPLFVFFCFLRSLHLKTLEHVYCLLTLWTCVWDFDPSLHSLEAPLFLCEVDELPFCGAPLQPVINCGHHGSGDWLFSLIGYCANYLWIPTNAISPIDFDLSSCVIVICGLVCCSCLSLCA